MIPRNDEDRRALRVFLAIGLVLAVAYSIGLETLRRPDGRIIRGDAVFYYAYLRSAVFDRDLHFENDYLRLYGPKTEDPESVWTYQTTPTGYVENTTSIGPAIVWAPLFLLVAAAVYVADLAGAGYPLDGFGRAFQLSAGYSGILAATAGAYVSYRLCRLWFDAAAAMASAIVLWLGSSALYYSMVSPTYSHAATMLVASLFFYAWATTLDDRSYRRFALLGALGGLAALVRWQDAIFLVVPATDALAGALRAPRGERLAASLRVAVQGAACALGFLLAFSPQIAVWMILYGRPFTIPQGGDFMVWGAPKIAQVLFSSRRGLFTWTPVVLPAVAGLFLLRRERRDVAPALIVAFLVSLYVNAAVSNWWAGASFGARRFVSCFPIFVIGLAAAYERLRREVAEVAGALLVVLNALLLLQFQLFMHGFTDIASKPDRPYELWLARFAVPFELLARLWAR